MDFEETMVENTEAMEADDTLPEEIAEETDESEESLESAIGDEQPAEESAEPEPKATEPGWIKKRVDKAVTKAVAEALARQKAEFEQQMAPIRASLMENEAQELLRSKKVADIETARELVRLRNGMPAEQKEQAAEQPRSANGQFAAKDDPATSARIGMLRHQADRIKAAKGPDVIAEFQNNEEIKQKVIKGEMDFYDVADYLKTKKPSRKPPSPMRSPNGASGQNPNAIENMTAEQFARLEKKISEGARIRLG